MVCLSIDFDSILDVEGQPDAQLLSDLKNMIVRADAEKPRSLQKVPGPSEVGHPCKRRLAYGINRARSSSPGAKGYNINSDPMAAIVGTSMHDWLEKAAQADNVRRGKIRWVTEQRVVVRPAEYELSEGEKVCVREELAGTCDLYDFDTRTIIDHKTVGSSVYTDIVKNGPGAQRIGQANLYGRGFLNLGFPVEHVALFFISRVGTLRQVHLWRQPYDQGVVDGILGRLDEVETEMALLNTAEDPSGFLKIPITPTDSCRFCPWWSANPEGNFQCKGNA